MNSPVLEIQIADIQVVQQLMDEYRAATRKDYVNFGNTQTAQVSERIFDLDE